MRHLISELLHSLLVAITGRIDDVMFFSLRRAVMFMRPKMTEIDVMKIIVALLNYDLSAT